MLLERIRLKTIGCFEARDVELQKGVNLIFGPNFSGKSTLVNAIFFTLTGKPIVPRVDTSAIAQAKADTGTAGLQFVTAGKRYQLFRATRRRLQLRYERDGAWHVVFDDNRIKATEAYLQEHFGIRHEQLALTTFLREGEIFEFLARQSTTRRDILHTLLGIDRLIEVRERFVETRRIAKREQNRLHKHQASLRFNGQNINRDEIARLEETLEGLEAAYGADTADAPLIAEWQQRQDRLQKRFSALEEAQRQALSGFSDSGQLREMIAKIEAGLQENTELGAKREARIQDIGRLESEMNALTRVCETLQGLLAGNEQHCPTCYQKVERAVVQQIIAEKAAEASQRRTELETHQAALQTETENLAAHQKLEQRLRTLKECSTRFEQHARDIQAVQEELREVQTRLTERGIREGGHGTPDPAAVVDKPKLKAQIDEHRKRLENFRKQEAVRQDRLAQLQRVNREAEKVGRTVLSLELACDGVDRTIDTLQRQILKPAEEELHRWVEKMSLFGQTRIDLQRQHLLPSLNIDGVDRSLMLLSGSEKMFLYLCFKVALAKVLGNPGFFVFDDPTLHLDGERKALMVDFIRQLAAEHQVIVTSYDEDVRSGLTGAHLIEMTHTDP